MINILAFEVRYRNGKREDWVTYAPKHNPLATTSEKVSRLVPPKELKRDNQGVKAKHMHAIWSVIGPAYESWLKGEEIPEDGLPLQAWPGVHDAQVKELRKHGLRTVEDVAGITDAQVQHIHLPDVRNLRRQAQAFLDAQAGADTARKIADQEGEMAAMREMLEKMRVELEAAKGKKRTRKEAEAA